MRGVGGGGSKQRESERPFLVERTETDRETCLWGRQDGPVGKVAAPKADHLSWIPRSHTLEGQPQPPKVIL